MLNVYIHGFNSGAGSRSGKELARILKSEVFCPEYDYSEPFETCRDGICEQIKAAGAGEYRIMGSSLGGFYALQLRFAGIRQVLAWNPVIFPALQLAQFLGENYRFSDGGKWDFGKAALLSYAAAPDPRVWENFYWAALEQPEKDRPERKIFLGDRDEILNSDLAWAFWEGHARLREIHSAHQVEDYSHVLDAV